MPHASWSWSLLCLPLASAMHRRCLRMFESFIAKWGYVAIATGVLVEGETLVLVAGAMAHRGLLSLWGVILAAFLTSLLGDQLWFELGARYGRPFIDRRPAWRRRVLPVERLFA